MVDLLYYIFPKTWYLDKLNNDLLMRSQFADQLAKAGEKPAMTFPPGVTWEAVIISSAIFVVAMLALSCWRFAKRDY